VVAPAGPSGQVTSAEQRAGLGVAEVGDQVALGALGRDRQDTLDRACVLGVAQGKVAEQGVDRCQAAVAGRDAVAPVLLQVFQERGDQRRVEVGDVQAAGRLLRCAGSEGGQELEGELAGGDRVRAGGAPPISRWVK
jgi:hypothetical protein